MATDPLTDATEARTLLELAVAWDSAPELTDIEVDQLFALASSENDDAETVYTGIDLNRSASLGWQWKAGKVAGYFTTALPDGMKFNREQVYEHCMTMAANYANGVLSVIGTGLPGARRSGIASVGLMTSTSADYWESQA
jgi:hypothetical protein